MTNESRVLKGKIASIVGIFLNIFLALSKIVIGIISGFVSVMADGFNNLSDCGSSVVSLISFKMSSKPADKEHPFGHERVEYIFSMIVAFIILIIAFELAKESITKIVSPQKISFSIIVIATLLVSILVKSVMFTYYKMVAKKIDSEILKAAAIDSLFDCITTTLVLISIFIGKFTGFNVDGYAGLVVVVFISVAGIKIIKEMVSKLIGQAPSQKVIDDIKARILSFDDIMGMHDLNVYSYGPNKYFASVHIELDASIDSLVAHEIIDNIERDFLSNTNIVLTGHHDPIVTNDEEVSMVYRKVKKYVANINKSYSMHDFRMVKGPTRTNVIFEIAVPFDNDLTEEEIIKILEEKILKINKRYVPIIMIEKQLIA